MGYSGWQRGLLGMFLSEESNDGEVRMSQKRFQQISDLLLIFSLFFIANASALFFVLWLSPAFVTLEFILWLVLTIIAIWYLKKGDQLSDFIGAFRKNWFILPFLIFSGLSIFWSVYWEISTFRWLMLLFTIIAGGYIGLNYDLKKMIQLVVGIWCLYPFIRNPPCTFCAENWCAKLLHYPRRVARLVLAQKPYGNACLLYQYLVLAKYGLFSAVQRKTKPYNIMGPTLSVFFIFCLSNGFGRGLHDHDFFTRGNLARAALVEIWKKTSP